MTGETPANTARGAGSNGRGRRWLGLALIASLALNLFFGGVLGGSWIAGWTAERPAAPARNVDGDAFLPLPRLAERLSPEARAEAHAVFRAQRGDIRAQFRGLRAARVAVLRDLTAEPFDQDRLARSLAALRTQTVATQAEIHEALTELAARLGPEERRRLAEAAGVMAGRRDGAGPPPGRGPASHRAP